MYEVHAEGYLAEILREACSKDLLKKCAPVRYVNKVDSADGGPKAIEMGVDGILARCEGPSLELSIAFFIYDFWVLYMRARSKKSEAVP